MKPIYLALLLVSFFSCRTFDDPNQASEIKHVVNKMNLALAGHQIDELLSCYSNEMDWENSFGWTITSKKTLNTYFADWLFTRYPTLDSNRLHLEFKVQIINSETAWVDVLQQIKSEDMKTVIRSYRQLHLLEKESNDWLIRKTRLWLPTPNENPPIGFLSSPSFFK